MAEAGSSTPVGVALAQTAGGVRITGASTLAGDIDYS